MQITSNNMDSTNLGYQEQQTTDSGYLYSSYGHDIKTENGDYGQYVDAYGYGEYAAASSMPPPAGYQDQQNPHQEMGLQGEQSTG